jgi:hypothetical protein
MTVNRLFSASVPPSAVVEHPPGLPTEHDAIPLGPIEGWDAYAPAFYGDRDRAVVRFDPVVEVMHGAKAIVYRPDGRPPRPYLEGSDTAFYFQPPGAPASSWLDRPAWYQSGATLRFVRKRSSA